MAVVTAEPIAVEVGGKTYELKPTLQAVRAVGQSLGGLGPAFRRIRDLDIDAMAAIIVAGCGAQMKNREIDALTEAVWQHEDKVSLGGDLIDYLTILLNGGRRPAETNQPGADEGNG